MNIRTALVVLLASATSAIGDIEDPLHPHPHPTSSDQSRFMTSRTAAQLDLPVEEEAFMFAIFGDRTVTRGGSPCSRMRSRTSTFWNPTSS